MKKINLGLVQMRSEKGAIDDNLNSMRQYVTESKAKGVNIICFPEMNITGYIDPAEYPQAVLTKGHPAIKRVAEMSREYEICIIAGFVEENPEAKPYITQFVAGDGKLLGFYRKKTIKDEEAEWFSPGDSIAIFNYSGVWFGLAVCADIDDPEIFREYAQKGVSIVFESAAPGLYGEQETRNWQSGYNWWKNNCHEKLGKYAADNALFIAVATQAGRTIDEDFPGGGYVFDPHGECIYETKDWSEGVLYAEVDLS